MNGTAMSNDDREKLTEYLDLIEARILGPLQSEAVRGSCCTTLLLFFAAADALGALIEPDDQAGNGERSETFFRFMGATYEAAFSRLWRLRNALVHSAANVESYLSSTEMEGWVHLSRTGPTGLLYVNTDIAARDLVTAFRRVRRTFEQDAAMAIRAAKRLEWVEDNPAAGGSEPQPTPPPPVRFLWARSGRRRKSRRLSSGTGPRPGGTRRSKP